MDALIAIPDLDDDEVYPLDGNNVQGNSDAQRPKPFRGAAAGNDHSRSGSGNSFESSIGSRLGPGSGTGINAHAYNGAAVGSGSGSGSSSSLLRGVNGGGSANSGGQYAGGVAASGSSGPLAAITPTMPSFPRKPSFASLKAAFNKGSNAPTQDAYPAQLRNPFSGAPARNEGGPSTSTAQSLSEATPKMHGRQDSFVSSGSRGRVPASTSFRHAPQTSLYSDQSHAPSTSLSDSTSAASHSHKKAGGSIPPMPPFPEVFHDNMAPARTAYAKSLAHNQGAQVLQNNRSENNVSGGEAWRNQASYDQSMDQYHHRHAGINKEQSEMGASIAAYGNSLEYATLMGEGGDTAWEDPQQPLVPPSLPFAEAARGRSGSSGGSLAFSEDGARVPGDVGSSNGHARNGNMPSRQMYANRDNSSVASLPPGIGLENPISPAEYAINVLCSRFMTLAGVRVRGAIGGVDEPDPSLVVHLAQGTDAALDTLIDSLAHISRKNPRPVVESLLHWRDTILEERVDVGEVRGALAGSHAGLSLGVKNIAEVLTRRKALATAYLLARVLMQIASHFSAGGPDNPVKGLSDAQLTTLHGKAFELMRDCSRDRCAPSKMQMDAFENAAKLLGELSKTSFVAIGDRYVAYLEQCQRSATAAKEGDVPTETAIWAIRHLSITPYPMELFEEGAEFFEVIAKFFSNSHGQRIKSSYADALTQLILPVAKSASAELHHPTWIRALDFIGPRAFAMLQKLRYWLVAYPLYAAVLCVSPEERFLQSTQSWSWFPCLEAGVSKMSKDRSARHVVLDTALWLLWTYLFRCRESSTTTTKRMEAYFKIWFPLQRQNIWPADHTSIDRHVYMLHYALYRQFDFGRDMVLEFLRHTTLGGNTLSLQPELLSKQRMTIAIRAILLTLDSHVKGESPPFPSESKFEIEKEGLGDELPEGYSYPTADIGAAQAKFNDLIGKIALLCDHQVGPVSVMDDGVILTRGVSIALAMAGYKGTADEDRLIWRLHESHRFIAAYPKEHQPVMDLLRTCIESWPRCLSSSIAFPSVLSLLFRAQLSADPRLALAASQCLTRISKQRKGGAVNVVSSYMRSIVRLQAVFWETHPRQLLILSKIERAVRLLVSFLDIWLSELRKTQATAAGKKGWEMERTSAWAVIDEVEAIGMFLLCSAWRPLRRQAIAILRAVAEFDDVFSGTKRSSMLLSASGAGKVQEPTRIIHLLSLPIGRFAQPTDPKSNDIEDPFASNSQKWKRSTFSDEILLDIAESDKSSEANTWLNVVPRFLRACLEHFPTTVAVFRSIVTNRIFGMEAAVSIAAGVSNRALANTSNGTLKNSGSAAASTLMSFASGTNAVAHNPSNGLTSEQALMSDHWRMYVLALCTTTTSIEGGAQRSLQGEVSSERVIAAKDLFQKMVPYLASDQPRFQDAVVIALGNININLYKTLLETLQMVNSQLSEDFKRAGSKRNRRNERLRTALARVVQLTSPHMTREGTLNDQPVVFLILQWVKDTFNFLTDKDVRTEWEFHQIRRFFAIVVEEFFDALQQKDVRPGNDIAERFLTYDTRLRMFRLFRDWHSFSQAAKDGPAKLTNLLATVAEQHRDDRNREHVLSHLRLETQLLSFQASSAMAALCQGVMILRDGSNNATQQVQTALEPGLLIEWLEYLFRSTTTQNHRVASRALKALMTHNFSHRGLMRSTLERAFQEPEARSSENSFFAVLSAVVAQQGYAQTSQIFPCQQIICLGLIKLGHPDVGTRKNAFTLLTCVIQAEAPTAPMQSLEGGVSSSLPATYLRAQRDVSTHLANCFPQHKVAMLSEYTLRLPNIDMSRRATTLGLLPEWLHQIKLVTDEDVDAPGVKLQHRASIVLSNLLAITIRYGDEHNFEIQDMWASLVESDDYSRNATVIVKFLIQQALIIRSPALIMHAKRVVSCLSHTVLVSALLLEFCSYIEPSSMIPVPLDQERTNTVDPSFNQLYRADIENLLPPPSRRQTFSPGQIALLYVGELTYDRSQLLLDKLPLLLHAIFMQVDSLSAFTQEQVMAIFEQLVKSTSSENADVSAAEILERLFGRGTSIFWTQEDEDFDASNTLASMRTTVMDTLALLRTQDDNLKEKWGNVALHWATSNPVRHMACRSFQLFRILLPDINYTMLADMLGRLSNTISDSTRVENQSFALEILYTLKAIVRNFKAQKIKGQEGLLSHIFWMNVACLSTVNEAEFGHSIALMLTLLDCIDLNSRETVALLRSKCPEAWEGDSASLQSLVMRGLKSSALCEDSFRLLAVLSRVDHDDLVETPDSRVGYLFMACMPWFLQMTDDASAVDEGVVTALAQDIASLAMHHNQPDLERVAASIARKRFRTKDDLLRQAVSSCKRTGFIPKHTSGVVLLLLGLTFNAHDWIRQQTLQLLKILFQSLDPKRRDLDEYGPELLMPLLRLLSTKHSMEVLEVLDEKILSSGPAPNRLGPNAQQILRMSLQWHRSPAPSNLARRGTKSGRGRVSRNGPGLVARPSILASSNATQDVNSLFGLPEDTGWSVANIPEWSTRTRINILSVFKEVELLLDTPPVGEVNFVDEYDVEGENVFDHTMTASRLDVEDDVDSFAHLSRNAPNGQSMTHINMTADKQSLASQASTQFSASHEGRDSIGDIVNQLHDLSSFFIDDDSASVQGDREGLLHRTPGSSKGRRYQQSDQDSPPSIRRHLFWGSSGSNSNNHTSSRGGDHEDASGDVAKILGRSALTAMIARGSSHRIASGLSDDSQGTPTPMPRDMQGEGGDYLSSKNLKDDTSPKRSGVFGRKGLFARKVTPTSTSRMTSETAKDGSDQVSLPPSESSVTEGSRYRDQARIEMGEDSFEH